jgi:hypothetical protein
VPLRIFPGNTKGPRFSTLKPKNAISHIRYLSYVLISDSPTSREFGRLACGDRVLPGSASLGSFRTLTPLSPAWRNGRTRPEVVAFSAEQFA